MFLYAVIYIIEFQKHGLPHAHILLFLYKKDKYPTAKDINRIISVEIPNKQKFPTLFEAVSSLMIHDPCGQANGSSHCIADGKCSKYFLKVFNEFTVIDEKGYLQYKNSNNGVTIEKNGVILDNRFIIPYNPNLLTKYMAHINMEWCNQSRSIKYLFKYVNKGHDRVTAAFYDGTENSGSE